MTSADKPKPRLWPVAAILALDAAYLAYVWLSEAQSRQNRILMTMTAQVLTLGLLVLWLAFFSRIRVKLRLAFLAGVVALAALAAATLEIREVTGDIVPKVVWRWSPPPDALLEAVEKTAGDAPPVTGDAAAAYPQFLGPDRNLVVANVRLARDWETNPPVVRWRQPIGAGWSAFAVFGNRAVTQEQRGEEEMVSCYDLQTGALIWAHGDPGRYETTLGGAGPRATPTIADGRVYALGALGRLNCLDLASGALIWTADIQADNDGRMPQWGYAGSPLIAGRFVAVSPGGGNGRSLVAYDRETGEIAWRAGDDAPGYSSPQLRTLAGAPQIIILNAHSVTAHDPETGAILWNEPWGSGSPNVANPLALPADRLLVSSGYGVGCKLYQVSASGEGLALRELYSSPRLKAKFANFVPFGAHVYGLDDGVLTAVAIADGQRAWKRGRYGHGQLLLAGDLLLLQAEAGSLHLIEPNPDSLRELGAIEALDGKAWNTMALSGNLLLMRNHEEAICFKLPLRSDSGD